MGKPSGTLATGPAAKYMSSAVPESDAPERSLRPSVIRIVFAAGFPGDFGTS